MACVFLMSTYGSSSFLFQSWDTNAIPTDERALKSQP